MYGQLHACRPVVHNLTPDSGGGKGLSIMILATAAAPARATAVAKIIILFSLQNPASVHNQAKGSRLLEKNS